MKTKIITALIFVMTTFSTVGFSANFNGFSNYVADSVTTAKIYTKYAGSDVVSMYDINVMTDNNGQVKLVGRVDTDQQKNEAIKIANTTDGVQTVNADDLIVTISDQPISDTWITTKARVVLFSNGLLSDLDVESKDGTVYLTGKSSASNIKTAVTKIQTLDGVKKVDQTTISQ